MMNTSNRNIEKVATGKALDEFIGISSVVSYV